MSALGPIYQPGEEHGYAEPPEREPEQGECPNCHAEGNKYEECPDCGEEYV